MVKSLFRFFIKFIHGLSFKLSFNAGLIMFLALLAFAYHSISAHQENLIKKMIQESLKDSEVIKAAIWNGMMTNDREVIKQIVETIGRQERFREINIYDVKGRLHYSSRSDVINQGQVDTPLLRNIAVDASAKHMFSEDGKFLYVVNPVLNEKSCSTAACHAHPDSEKILGALEVKVPLDDMKQEIYKSTRNTIVFAFALFIMVSTIIGLAVIFLVIPNIKRLQDSAAKMARGEYDPQKTSSGSDEMADLIRAFDKMSWEINQRTAELAASRELYRRLFDEVPCYLTVVDKNYRIVRANRTFRDEFGDLVGTHCFKGYKGLDSKCEKCPVERTFSEGVPHQSEEIWKLYDSNVNVIVKTSPIFDENGNVAEVLEMSVDVTKLKQLQTELEKKQREFKNLFEHVPCYLTVVDSDFNIIQTNELFDQHFGKKLGSKCYRAYKLRDTKCENCPVEKTFQDGLSHHSEEIWRRNGEETYIMVTTAPISDDSGNITAVMEMSTNVTEIKRLQSELVILGETIAGMSHTIKNIVSGLQGGVYIVDSGLERNKEERIRTGWAMVKNNVEKISDLVKGILYASKEREPDYKECDPGQLLTEVCDLYQERARLENIRLVRNFQPSMGSCMLDPAGIHSAISNLISNAIEACMDANGGKEHVVEVSGRFEGNHLLLRVTDDGNGMTGEVISKLFSKFHSTKGSKGTGLGLVITRKVIEEHGGKIRVKSEPGKGTSFFIDIPLKNFG